MKRTDGAVIDLPAEVDARLIRFKMNSSFNRWVTGEKVGHDPDHNERALNFIACGISAYRTRFHRITNSPAPA
jgi:hypothetical protein